MIEMSFKIERNLTEIDSKRTAHDQQSGSLCAAESFIHSVRKEDGSLGGKRLGILLDSPT
jgi:hypothetical protein